MIKKKTIDWVEIARKYKGDIRKVVVTTVYLPCFSGVVGRHTVTRIYLNWVKLEKYCSLAQKLGLPESCKLTHDEAGTMCLQFSEGKELWDVWALKAQYGEDYASHEEAQDKMP